MHSVINHEFQINPCNVSVAGSMCADDKCDAMDDDEILKVGDLLSSNKTLSYLLNYLPELS